MGLIFASAESGAPGVAFSFIHLHTIYRLYPQSSILGSTSTLSCAASAETLRTQCGVSRRSGGDCGVRPAGPASTASLCPIICLLRLNPHTAHIYKCTIATRTMQSAQPKTPLRSVERGRPLPPLVTHRAATLTRAPSPSHRRPHAPPSHALPSHALPLRITLSKSGAADPYLDEAVVARGGHGCAIRRHCHRGHVPGWGWH